MPVITKLLFRENLVTAELDNGEVLGFSYPVYSQYKLSSGMDISGDLYMELYEESRKTECWEKALKYLAVRSRSVDEMEKYLRKKNFTDNQISETVRMLKDKKYLDDYEFSTGIVKSRMKSGRYGRDIIVRDLYSKGINRRIIDKVIKECGADNTDEERLYALALKKYMSVKDKDNSISRVGNYLRQRGFDYESIKKVLRRLEKNGDME